MLDLTNAIEIDYIRYYEKVLVPFILSRFETIEIHQRINRNKCFIF